MQSRSIRRSGQPTRAIALSNARVWWDLIRGGHYGQRSCEPHYKAGHMAAPTNAAKREESPCQPGAVHTWHETDIPSASRNVCFSNRPFGVKRFQTIHHHSVDVAHGLVLSLRNRHQGPSIMGFEDGVEQSF